MTITEITYTTPQEDNITQITFLLYGNVRGVWTREQHRITPLHYEYSCEEYRGEWCNEKGYVKPLQNIDLDSDMTAEFAKQTCEKLQTEQEQAPLNENAVMVHQQQLCSNPSFVQKIMSDTYSEAAIEDWQVGIMPGEWENKEQLTVNDPAKVIIFPPKTRYRDGMKAQPE